MKADECIKLFQKNFDEVLSSPIPLEEKLELLNGIFCNFIGHVTAMMYYLDPMFYFAGDDKGIESLAELAKTKIIKSAKEQIKTIWLFNEPPKGHS